MRRAGLLAIVVVVLAAGCGGTSKPTVYSLKDTRQCVRDKQLRTGGKLDFVASTATGGAFVAHTPHNFVTVVFGDTEDDAKQIDAAYHRFAFANVRAGLEDVLKRDRNAVMLWHKHPQAEDLQLITSCLK